MCQFIKLINLSKKLLLIQNTLLLMLLISANLFADELATERPMSGLLYQDAKGRSNSVPLLSTKVLMNVNGLINRVSVKQMFVNDSENWITASYLFPLPENAAVDHLNIRSVTVLSLAKFRKKYKLEIISKKRNCRARNHH